MRKIKFLMITLFIGIAVFLVHNISHAATEHTYSDVEQNIEWTYELDSNDNIINLKLKTTSKTGTINIPAKIDGKNVISLKRGAFQDCVGLIGVSIPNTITTIGEYAFDNCTGLKTVTIPDSVTNIGNDSFDGCSGITSIVLSQNLISIGDYAFYGCSGLKSVTIPNSVITIGEGAFKNCSGIKDLTLSKNLTKITRWVFEGCSGLTSVILPDSVTTIVGGTYNGAFGGCTKLSKILIPDSVASIGENAFANCDKLTIYGNDGMTSKEYAETNKIKFDYIANWDKKDSGTDITPPTVKNIEVTEESVINYNKDTNKNMYMIPAGAKLVINVNFSETIEGTTVPTLTIKFGEGQNIKLTEGTVGGSKITYIYNIQNLDKGVMATVDLSGGNIKDSVGNEATLSCPGLSIQYNSGEFVYANGNVINPDNETNKPNDGNANKPDNENANNSGNSNNNGTDGKKDDTIANGKLPQAGVSIVISLVIIVLLASCVFAYCKYHKLKGI